MANHFAIGKVAAAACFPLVLSPVLAGDQDATGEPASVGFWLGITCGTGQAIGTNASGRVVCTDQITNSTNSVNATNAVNANTANYAVNAGTLGGRTETWIRNNATGGTVNYATSAGSASSATYANTAGSASSATYATNAGIATTSNYSSSAGKVNAVKFTVSSVATAKTFSVDPGAPDWRDGHPGYSQYGNVAGLTRYTSTVSARFCQSKGYTLGQGQELSWLESNPNAIDSVIACY